MYTIVRINQGLAVGKFVESRDIHGSIDIFERSSLTVQQSTPIRNSSHSTETPISNSTSEDATTHSNCDQLHLLFLVDDLASVAKMTRALKSILFYRRSPIVLHVVVLKRNGAVKQTIDNVFATWDLKEFSFHIYTSYHRLETFPLLNLNTMLPSEVESVIILSVNVTLNSDITQLWNHFHNMQKTKKLFGVVKVPIAKPDHSSCTNDINDAHYNSGVILMDLQQIRRINDLNKAILGKGTITSAEFQELTNTFTYVLPCKWGIRVSNTCNSSTACESYPHDVGIMLMDAEKTQVDSKNELESYSAYLSQMWMQMDSQMLEKVLFHCPNSLVSEHKQKKNTLALKFASGKFQPCHKLFQTSSFVFHTHKYFIGQKYSSPDQFDVTLVTQLTYDRLSIFFQLLNHWKGPVSATLYCTDYEAWQLTEIFRQAESDLQKRKNIAIHVVLKSGEQFPVNYLRNVALLASSTPFVFLSDCDFLTSNNLYPYLMKAAATLQGPGAKKRAMIVPAFESLVYDFKFPTTKLHLLEQCKKGNFQIFHKNWFSGHGPTNYNKWSVTRYPYVVKWADYFEPYILVDRNVPQYSEQFYGYGYNKASHIMEVKARGYEFVVLPGGFVIHSPHTKTAQRSAFINNDDEIRSCISELKKDFIKNLARKYGKDCLKNPPGKTISFTNVTNLVT